MPVGALVERTSLPALLIAEGMTHHPRRGQESVVRIV